MHAIGWDRRPNCANSGIEIGFGVARTRDSPRQRKGRQRGPLWQGTIARRCVATREAGDALRRRWSRGINVANAQKRNQHSPQATPQHRAKRLRHQARQHAGDATMDVARALSRISRRPTFTPASCKLQSDDKTSKACALALRFCCMDGQRCLPHVSCRAKHRQHPRVRVGCRNGLGEDSVRVWNKDDGEDDGGSQGEEEKYHHRKRHLRPLHQWRMHGD